MPCVIDDSSSFYSFRRLCMSEIGGFVGEVGVVCVWLIVVKCSVVAGADSRINLFVPSQRSFVLPSSSGNGARPIARKGIGRDSAQGKRAMRGRALVSMNESRDPQDGRRGRRWPELLPPIPGL